MTSEIDDADGDADDVTIRKAPQIRSGEFPYDMAPWVTEKAEYVVQAIGVVVDLLRGRKDLPPDFVGSLNSQLATMANGATKLMSFGQGQGSEWTPEDAEVLLDRGRAGVEELRRKYAWPGDEALPGRDEEGE